MINLSDQESFDITINRYFRNKWRMKINGIWIH